jgi:hypothetical protein
METLMTLTAVTMATAVALFAALALEFLLLKGMFLLMQPLALNRSKNRALASRNAQAAVEQGARLLAQAYGKTR